MVDQERLKQAAARAALDSIRPRLARDCVLGVGTGSTANHFIDLLAGVRGELGATVASSEASARRLRGHGIPVRELDSVGRVDVYVDGADESNASLQLIKGGGGALTREKILAAAAGLFICICDESKLVAELGAFPLPVEVIPMARGHVSGELARLGGEPVHREGAVTDNGNSILDVRHFPIADPPATETAIDGIAGVVSSGLFARRPADVLLLGQAGGVRELRAT